MKRQRTSTFTKAERPVQPGEKRHLSTVQKRDVKSLIAESRPRSVANNSSTGTGGAVTGALASAMTPVLAFTATTKGNEEYQRRGDQIWMHKIKFRCRVVTTATDEYVRFLVVRQVRGGMPPLPVDPGAILVNSGAGMASILSNIASANPTEILLDKTIQFGLGTQYGESRIFEFTLDWDKRPKRVEYLDGTAVSSPATTAVGDIELLCATRGSGTVTMSYVYQLDFSEK